jgi:hypothetical protein
MTQKQQILELIKKEKQRFNKNQSDMFRKFFMTNGDKRWYDGICFGLEELETLIEIEVKDEFTIDFAYWVTDSNNIKTKDISIEELLEIYKKEKSL